MHANSHSHECAVLHGASAGKDVEELVSLRGSQPRCNQARTPHPHLHTDVTPPLMHLLYPIDWPCGPPGRR